MRKRCQTKGWFVAGQERKGVNNGFDIFVGPAGEIGQPGHGTAPAKGLMDDPIICVLAGLNPFYLGRLFTKWNVMKT